MSKPYFVGIGAQRAGTTWLGEYLAGHPQVGFSPIKELHYFDVVYRNDLCNSFRERARMLLNRAVKHLKEDLAPSQLERIRCLTLNLEMYQDERLYREYFDRLAEDSHRIVGEITPAYAILNEDGFGAIRRLHEDARFLFVLRDPADRFLSQVRYSWRCKPTDKIDWDEMSHQCVTQPRYVLRTDYKRTLCELYKVAPKESVCVAFFEHLTDPKTHESELRRITDFLGIDFVPGELEAKKNVGRSVGFGDEHDKEITSAFSGVYEYVDAEFGDRMPARWRERMAAL